MKHYHIPNIILLFILILLIAGTGYYVYESRPCAQTIYYKVGTFDTRFGISQSAYIADLQQAASLWNQAAGKTLLAYSATGTMPVNLIYDTRQQDTDIGESITQQEQDLATQKANVQQLQNAYAQARQTYETDQASGRVGAAQLNQEAQQLNAQSDEINSMVTQLNAQISQTNANANNYNQTAAGASFEEGEFVQQYGQKHIDIYQFTDNTKLVRLMAHEFGHSIGLGHNQNPDSIMYPDNQADTISLSADDIAALNARCALTWQNLDPFTNGAPSTQ
jgi:predicted Zn-dependent protease